MVKFGLRGIPRFSQRSGQFQLRVRQTVEQTSLEMAKRLRDTLAIRNPVLTGRSSASWNLSAGDPDDSHKPRSFRNPTPARLRPPIANVDTSGFKLGIPLHITNTVPYIRRLESGHSTQQPNGWIAATVQSFKVAGMRAFRGAVRPGAIRPGSLQGPGRIS